MPIQGMLKIYQEKTSKMDYARAILHATVCWWIEGYQGPVYLQRLHCIWQWVGNDIYWFMWDATIIPCAMFNTDQLNNHLSKGINE